jgi:hypothetical protein
MNKTEVSVARLRKSERGSAGVKFLLVGVVLFLIGHAGCNYIPVAYQGESYKQEMHTAVLQGTALPSTKNPVGVVKDRLLRSARENGLPEDALIEVKQVNNAIQAHVRYSTQIDMLPFGLYKREYLFDQTVIPSGFLMKDN